MYSNYLQTFYNFFNCEMYFIFIRSVVLSAMDEFSSSYPDEFVGVSVNSLVKFLNEGVSPTDNETQKNILTALALCSPNNAIICEIVVSFVLSKLNTTPHDIDMLNALAMLIEKGCSNHTQQDRNRMAAAEFIGLVCLKLKALEQVFSMCATSYTTEEIPVEKLESSQNQSALNLKDQKVRRCLEVCASIVRNVMKSCTIDVQEVFMTKFWGKVNTTGVEAMLPTVPVRCIFVSTGIH